jgi:hypothetical protein
VSFLWRPSYPCEAESLRGDQIYTRSNLVGSSTGISPGLAAQNSIDMVRCAPKPSGLAWSIGWEAPASDKIARAEDRQQSQAERKRKDAHEVGHHELIDCSIKRFRFPLEHLEKNRKRRCYLDYRGNGAADCDNRPLAAATAQSRRDGDDPPWCMGADYGTLPNECRCCVVAHEEPDALGTRAVPVSGVAGRRARSRPFAR